MSLNTNSNSVVTPGRRALQASRLIQQPTDTNASSASNMNSQNSSSPGINNNVYNQCTVITGCENVYVAHPNANSHSTARDSEKDDGGDDEDAIPQATLINGVV